LNRGRSGEVESGDVSKDGSREVHGREGGGRSGGGRRREEGSFGGEEGGFSIQLSLGFVDGGGRGSDGDVVVVVRGGCVFVVVGERIDSFVC